MSKLAPAGWKRKGVLSNQSILDCKDCHNLENGWGQVRVEKAIR